MFWAEDAVLIGAGMPGFSAFGLRVKAMLDREAKDSYAFNLTCEIHGDDGVSEKLWIPGTLHVLDQNDNPPMTQQGLQHETVYVSMQSGKNSMAPVTPL